MNIKKFFLFSAASLILNCFLQLSAQADIISDRQITCLDGYIAAPWPDPNSTDPDSWIWGKAGYALACLYRNHDITKANNYVNDLCNRQNPIPSTGSNDKVDIWFELPMLARIYLDPNMNSRLTATAKSNIERVMFQLANPRSSLADANGRVWMVYGSENLDMILKSDLLLGLQLLRQSPAYGPGCTLNDGHTIEQHYSAWKKYFFEYFRQRAREGLSCEIASNGYNKYTIGCWYNVCDLSEDSALRKLVKDYLTLFWADYAGDFLPATGLRGGAETRCYKNSIADSSDGSTSILYAYGWHNSALALHPFQIITFASPYRNPAIVDTIGRAVDRPAYLNTTRRFGKGGGPNDDIYTVKFDSDNCSNIRRDTWWHKDYVMGSLTFKTFASAWYTALINQNRMMGIFYGSAAADRVIFDGNGTDAGGNKGLSEISGVCRENCMVAGWDKSAQDNKGVFIFLSNGSLLTNKVDDASGWIFTKTGPNGIPGYYIADNDPNRHNDLKLGDFVSASTSPYVTIFGEGQGEIGEALYFDGSNDVAYATQNWAGYNSVRLDFYFMSDSASNGNDQVMVNAPNTWQVVINTANVKFSVWNSTGALTLTCSNVVVPGTWQHVIATNNADGSTTLYVDGRIVTGASIMKMQSASLVLGNKPGYTRFYGGMIDTMRISIPSQNNKLIASWDMDRSFTKDVYTAIRIANGGYATYVDTLAGGGSRLVFKDKYAPVVFQTAPAGDWASLTAFKNAVKALPFNYDTTAKDLTYTSLAGDSFEYWGNSQNLPKINGSTVDLNPANTYDSPYLQGVHGMDTVTISYPGYNDIILNFCSHDSPAWDDYKTVALWHMDANSAGTVVDDNLENNTRHNDLTLYNGLTVTTGNGGKFGEALNLDGIDDYGSIANGWASSTSFQTDVWIYPTDSTGTHAIVSAANIWSIDITDGKLSLWTSNSNGSNSYLRFNTDISLNTWHRVLANCDAQGNRMLIVDDASICDNVGAGLVAQTASITVGSTTGTANYYAGMIDDVKISNYASVPASMSGDLDNNKAIDYFDLLRLAGQWLNSCDEQTWCNGVDIDRSHRVDFADFAVMAANWLIDGNSVSIPY